MESCGLLMGKPLPASPTPRTVRLAASQVSRLLQGLSRGAGCARWTYWTRWTW